MEKDIKIIEEKIEIIECLCTDDCINKTTVIQPLKYALKNLIKGYKELEEHIQKYPIGMTDEQYKQTIENAQKDIKEELDRQINTRIINEEFIENNYISKDKIREKI